MMLVSSTWSRDFQTALTNLPQVLNCLSRPSGHFLKGFNDLTECVFGISVPDEDIVIFFNDSQNFLFNLSTSVDSNVSRLNGMFLFSGHEETGNNFT